MNCSNYIKETVYDWLFVCFIRWRWHQALDSTQNSITWVRKECGEKDSELMNGTKAYVTNDKTSR
jgi:hypothetical protein